jgi:hypothetical protein
MRVLALPLCCLLVAPKAMLACSVAIQTETLPSFPNVRLTVLKEGTPQRKVRLVVAAQINGQQVGPAFTTDARGIVELRNLAPGMYCITAIADPRLGAGLCLLVSNGHDRNRSEFSLKLATLPPPPPPPPTLEEQLKEATKSAPQVRVREFKGTVSDMSGAYISHAGLVVYVHPAEQESNLIRLEADEQGQFSVPLNPGSYTAAFQSPGFRTRYVGFTIGPDASQDSASIVLQVGSCP